MCRQESLEPRLRFNFPRSVSLWRQIRIPGSLLREFQKFILKAQHFLRTLDLTVDFWTHILPKNMTDPAEAPSRQSKMCRLHQLQTKIGHRISHLLDRPLLCLSHFARLTSESTQHTTHPSEGALLEFGQRHSLGVGWQAKILGCSHTLKFDGRLALGRELRRVYQLQ